MIRQLLDALDQIGDVTPKHLDDNVLDRLAIERVLTQLVDLAASINTHVVAESGSLVPESYRDSFRAAARVGLMPPDLATRLEPSAGMRNILVHEYLKADISRVAGAIPLARKGYGEYVAVVASYLSESAE